MRELIDGACQVLPHRRDVVKQTVALDDRDHCETGDGRDGVAAKCAAVAARTEQSSGRARRQASADRESIAKSLCQRDDVGPNALFDVHQPAAGPAHPGLHLVHPEQSPMLITDLPSPAEVSGGGTTM